MGSGAAIVRLDPGEWPRLKSLRLRALADVPEAFGATLAETAARPDDRWRRQVREFATFVAVVDDRDVGMVRSMAMRDDPTHAELISMWVEPGFRGQGVADALVAAVLDWAAGEGHASVVLDVKDDNPRAIAAYARLGFERVGPTPGAEGIEHRRARELG
ncbi:MAG: GNAT family N-acetyltransferase [Myxococcota bacterium]